MPDLPWISIVSDFYAFLDRACVAAKPSAKHPPSPAVTRLRDQVAPYRRFGGVTDSGLERAAKWISKMVSRPFSLSRWPRVRVSRFPAPIFRDVELNRDLSATIRLHRLFTEFDREKLLAYQRLLEIELRSLEHAFFSDSRARATLPAQLAFAIGLIAAWSAFCAVLLGVDWFSPLVAYVSEHRPGGGWFSGLASVIYGVGVIFLVSWCMGRFGNRKHFFLLERIQRSLALYLESPRPSPAALKSPQAIDP
ncbi:MAG: hypothetical protein AAGD32_16350 [Planctomycetota bacterium]